ncbi:MAG: nicotinate-nucleotide--dimethylbenzimidazole phosphoribosyltransferase [bacterium]|nr:nicotinate-nucleotide--dimethylbenzimidazole phosphoribosyltransferase [bacterium]
MIERNGFRYSEPKTVTSDAETAAWKRLDQKCMPPRAMGLLERVAVRIAAIQNTDAPQLTNPEVFIAAGDHGVMAHKVSFSPQDISWQHSINMAKGGGLCGLFAKKYALPLRVFDVGVKHDFSPEDGVVSCKVAYGTEDMLEGPAMTLEQCLKAMEAGRDQVASAAARGCNTIIFGEMGIGNTTPAAALTMAILHKPVEVCVGSGTGMGPKALEHKRSIVKAAAERHYDENCNAIELMARLGGYELAFIMGGMLEAAGQGMVILLDGFIVTAAALLAHKLDERVRDYMVACHVSNEPGHALQLEHLRLEPILRAGFCLGEGSGAILAWPLVKAAVDILNEMNSYDDGNLDNATEALNQAKAQDDSLSLS